VVRKEREKILKEHLEVVGEFIPKGLL